MDLDFKNLFQGPYGHQHKFISRTFWATKRTVSLTNVGFKKKLFQGLFEIWTWILFTFFSMKRLIYNRRFFIEIFQRTFAAINVDFFRIFPKDLLCYKRQFFTEFFQRTIGAINVDMDVERPLGLHK